MKRHVAFWWMGLQRDCLATTWLQTGGEAFWGLIQVGPHVWTITIRDLTGQIGSGIMAISLLLMQGSLSLSGIKRATKLQSGQFPSMLCIPPLLRQTNLRAQFWAGFFANEEVKESVLWIFIFTLQKTLHCMVLCHRFCAARPILHHQWTDWYMCLFFHAFFPWDLKNGSCFGEYQMRQQHFFNGTIENANIKYRGTTF